MLPIWGGSNTIHFLNQDPESDPNPDLDPDPMIFNLGSQIRIRIRQIVTDPRPWPHADRPVLPSCNKHNHVMVQIQFISNI